MASGWQAYIKNLVDNAPTVIKKAAIIGVSDGNIWARSEPPVGETFNVSHFYFSSFSYEKFQAVFLIRWALFSRRIEQEADECVTAHAQRLNEESILLNGSVNSVVSAKTN